ncbi:hypothetical protein DICVIV_10080 [Dictyocaulus viviparus]|uniref:Uncharacterized protein n=1 Tax=Dictyocaulus viviparus TaxID=29172 RepID=A0A0D8XGW1_DICVI|nr:hypothetical protein DICVIV_10080 [Dictyocaulus viviparus]
MAKSIRSKFKRKMRSIARVKKAHKNNAFLEAAVSRREAYEREQAAKEMEVERSATEIYECEAIDDPSKNLKPATINVKTMKRADGTYPPWISGSLIKKLSKKNKAAKKRKLQKVRSKR